MIEIGILKNFDSGTYKAGVQLAGSLTTYLDDISVARNIPSSALVIGNYVILAIPGGIPRDACVIAAWPQGGSGNGVEPSKSRAYRNGHWWVRSGAWTRVPLNAAIYDNNSELDVTSKIGTADATEANKLHDADGGFSAADVGKWLYNSTDYTYTQVAGFVDSGELDIADDIMANGENYELYAGTWIAKAAGFYLAIGVARCSQTLADKWYFAGVAKNGTPLGTGGFQSSVGNGAAQNHISGIGIDIIECVEGDELSLMIYHNEGNPAFFVGEKSQTYFVVHRLSKTG